MCISMAQYDRSIPEPKMIPVAIDVECCPECGGPVEQMEEDNFFVCVKCGCDYSMDDQDFLDYCNRNFYEVSEEDIRAYEDFLDFLKRFEH